MCQSYGFSSRHGWMWELDHKEGWALKNWCFWTMVLEKILESPLDCEEIKPVNPKGYQSWVFIGRTDAEAPVLWPPDQKNWLIGKDPDAGERLLLNHDTGILGPEGKEFNPGQESRLDRSELFCNKLLLKYKGDRESFWHRHQKGTERVPPC